MRRTFDQGVFFSNVECKQVLEKAHCKKKRSVRWSYGEGVCDDLMEKVAAHLIKLTQRCFVCAVTLAEYSQSPEPF